MLMPLRNRVYGAGKLLILVGALLVTYIVSLPSAHDAVRAAGARSRVPDPDNRRR
jgi:hypothetical protein